MAFDWQHLGFINNLNEVTKQKNIIVVIFKPLYYISVYYYYRSWFGIFSDAVTNKEHSGDINGSISIRIFHLRPPTASR